MNSDVTRLLSAIEQGDPTASDQLLPLVYEELRRHAAALLDREQPGQTLQPTALVHEAYVRLVGSGAEADRWENRRHFFAAAAESMRRILIEIARRKHRIKHGGEYRRQDLGDVAQASSSSPDDLLALDDALHKLQVADSQAAELIELRYFAGLPIVEAADIMGISERTAARLWAYAKAWLYQEIHGP